MDSFHFISTKLKMPLPRKNYLKRGDLFRKLEDALEYKVIVVKGAAGSGKTTLVTSFFRENPVSGLRWITLDRDNNNSYSFWYYFVEALKDYLGSDMEEINAIFGSILQNEDIDRLIPALINQMDCENDIVLVLDDFHLIDDPHLRETLEFFIKYSSDNIHLFLLTREEPSLYLSDLAMDGRLMSINENELCLTAEEGICFLKNTLKMNLSETVLNEINALSEGWIGGLQLIALASGSYGSGFIKNARVMDRQIIEYLSREILDSLDEGLKDFLIKTSILGYFDEEICNSLLEINNSEDVIRELHEKNLFIAGIGEDNRVYRYHNIFGEFLRLQFSKLERQSRDLLHVRASRIFEKRGDLDESIKQLFDAGMFRESIRVIRMIDQTLKAWTYLSRIPLEFVTEDLDAAFQRYFFHYCNFDWENCRSMYEVLKVKYTGRESLKMFDFANAIINDVYPEMDALSLEEIDRMGLCSVTRAIIFLKTSILLSINGRFREAMEFAAKASQIEENNKNPYMRIFILSVISSQIKEEMGEIIEGEALYEEAFRLIEQHKLLQSLKLNCLVGITGLYLKGMKLDKAEQTLETVRSLLDGKYASLERGYYHNLMELKLLKGQKQEASEIIRHLFGYDAYTSNFLHATDLIRYMLYTGSIDAEILDRFVSAYESGGPNVRLEDKLLYSRIMFLRGERKKALEVADGVLQFARKEKIKFRLLEAILLKVGFLSEDAVSNKREIFNLIREAVFYSCENRILSPFYLEKKLLERFMEPFRAERSKDLNLREKLFLDELFEVLNIGKFKDDILSDREAEVLGELATGASNKDIGERLCISLSTVKTHIINIYSKLQVSNRVEAIEKARSLGILK